MQLCDTQAKKAFLAPRQNVADSSNNEMNPSVSINYKRQTDRQTNKQTEDKEKGLLIPSAVGCRRIVSKFSGRRWQEELP